MDNKRPLYVALASQKGGVGKSTIVTLLASIYFYDEDKKVKVLVVDCDDKQNSVLFLRQRENSTLKSDKALFDQVCRYIALNGKYEILKATVATAFSSVDTYLKVSGVLPDLVLFDMPGKYPDSAEAEILLNMDYILSPIEPDRQSLASSLSYAYTLKTVRESSPHARLKEILLFWNKVKKLPQTANIMAFYNKQIERYSLSCLTTVLEDSSIYSRELSSDVGGSFRTTCISPAHHLRRRLHIVDLANEIANKIHLKYKSM